MKKFICTFLAATALTSALLPVNRYSASADSEELTVGCKSCYLMEYNSATCIYSRDETKRLPIASVCKVMTLTLCFEALKNNTISLDDFITVSESAAGMGGSQVFLGSNLQYKFSDLIKSIIVCSANDSCVAVSQALCGSQDKFVAKMNEKAEQLGCNNTLFVNCTGLPQEGQYSCARDVAVMFANLITYDDYFNYSNIWLEDFVHPDNRTTTMTNTNKLIKQYTLCDGGKTGFTNGAGFCLVSTAKSNNLRMISVVLGADSSQNRFKSSINLFEYAFNNYTNKIVLDKNVNLNEKQVLSYGKKEAISVHPERDSYVFCKKSEKPNITFNTIYNQLTAPISAQTVTGTVEVYKDGILCDTVNLLASENADRALYADYLKLIAKDWNF
jgi:D-alanyl-D-alanine carboxypeptidase (penicillin-binding protein 5/6)